MAWSGATLKGSGLQELTLAGKPVAYNFGLLSVNCGLLWGIVAYYLGLLGAPGA